MKSKTETPQDTFFLKNIQLNCNGKLLNLDETRVMGILNLTPDSFFDGGKHSNEAKILKTVDEMICDGVDVIDIGGYSSRPGAADIPEQEELKRVLPVIKVISNKHPELIISIDTFRANVAYRAIENGAAIINDISAGELDKQMLDCVSELSVPYIAMHMQGTPKNMQKKPKYNNVTLDIIKYFSDKLNLLYKKGISDVIIDPGFGFGKTIEQNYEILKNLNHFSNLEAPVLVGVSRKSMIYQVLETNQDYALNGTTCLNTIATLKGASFLRVHDVKAAKEVVKLVSKLKAV